MKISPKFKKLAIGVLAAPFISACAPDHTHRDGFEIHPDPGYAWRDSSRKSVHWVEGIRHPSIEHISSGAREGQWRADIGYVFGSDDSLKVYWKPGLRYESLPHVQSGDVEGDWKLDPGYGYAEFFGKVDLDLSKVTWKKELKHPRIPHVVSSHVEGSWLPEDGYRWVDPTDNQRVDVVWQEGLKSRNHPHIVSHEKEGMWIADPGYTFVDPKNSLAVRWAPSTPHPYVAHVYSGAEEGNWIPEPGYHFERDPNGKIIVAKNQGPDVGEAALSFGAAALADQCSTDEADDSMFTKMFIRPLCRAAREDLARNGVRALTRP